MFSYPSPNALIYKEDWTALYQSELDEPVKFFDFAEVVFTDSRVVHFPYTTDPTLVSGTRNCTEQPNELTRTDESVTVSDRVIAPWFIDYADLSQTGYDELAHMSLRSAQLIKEDLESSIYADNGAVTDFGTASIGGGGADTTTITVSASNVDDIVRAVKRRIRTAGGEAMLSRNGGFFVWRPADLELLEQFMQANGFGTADQALRAGGGDAQTGFNYLGFTHWGSNLLAANHVLAGVKKAYYMYILRETWGKRYVADPASGGDSGIGIQFRADFREMAWERYDDVLFDVNVA